MNDWSYYIDWSWYDEAPLEDRWQPVVEISSAATGEESRRPKGKPRPSRG